MTYWAIFLECKLQKTVPKSIKKLLKTWSFLNSANEKINTTKSTELLDKLEFFFYLGLVSRTLANHWAAGEEGGVISTTPLYQFHLLRWNVDISEPITANSSPLTPLPLVSERKSLTIKLKTLGIWISSQEKIVIILVCPAHSLLVLTNGI